MNIFKEILIGLQSLYENNIVHRDLKPANILLHDDKIKIADFGFSKIVDCKMSLAYLESLVGSPYYMSP